MPSTTTPMSLTDFNARLSTTNKAVKPLELTVIHLKHLKTLVDSALATITIITSHGAANVAPNYSDHLKVAIHVLLTKIELKHNTNTVTSLTPANTTSYVQATLHPPTRPKAKCLHPDGNLCKNCIAGMEWTRASNLIVHAQPPYTVMQLVQECTADIIMLANMNMISVPTPIVELDSLWTGVVIYNVESLALYKAGSISGEAFWRDIHDHSGLCQGAIKDVWVLCSPSVKYQTWDSCYTLLFPLYHSAVSQHLVPLPWYPIPRSGPLSIHYVSIQPQDTIFPLISALPEEAYQSTVDSTVNQEARDIGKEGIHILATKYTRGPAEITSPGPISLPDDDSDNKAFQYHPHLPTLSEYEAFDPIVYTNRPPSPPTGFRELANVAAARAAVAWREFNTLQIQEQSERAIANLAHSLTLTIGIPIHAPTIICETMGPAQPLHPEDCHLTGEWRQQIIERLRWLSIHNQQEYAKQAWAFEEHTCISYQENWSQWPCYYYWPDSNYTPHPLEATECLAYGEEYSHNWDEYQESQITCRGQDIPLSEHDREYWRNICDRPGDPASIGSRIHENLHQSLYRPYLGHDLEDVEDGMPMEGIRYIREGAYY
ncbi:hypothetical protein ARMSODRAFT_982671 [Armillaria solidipes]|uniref:Uncharacterized protein n=1 Tax=Armillaria solidipes TaxID=1076256 RepID=A0A2H3B819_9AGAR|nr:hypothetical protein ARMSODRAFT_982671 [Armillaria solidipes]